MEFVRNEDGNLEATFPDHFPFRISSREGEGRCLVATREIRPKETILTDSAILLGPSSGAVCIVCCSDRAEPRPCPRCGFRLCPSCSTPSSPRSWSPALDSPQPPPAAHPPDECAALARIGNTTDMFNLVLPVRFALLRSRDGDMFEWLLQYMDHNKERAVRHKKMAVSTARMAKIVAGAVSGLGCELSLRIIGILFTNCFEFSSYSLQARALYPLVSLINHSCIPNLRHTKLIKEMRSHDLEGEIVVMQLDAQRTVLPGAQLNIRYNHYTQGHLQRQSFLYDQWYFRCRCQRCEDPTEFGSNTSGLPCPSCGDLVLPCSATTWRCRACAALLPVTQIRTAEERLLALANTQPVPYNITTSLKQLHSLSKLLHNNHFIVMDLKQRFLFGFSMNLRKVRDLSMEQMQKLVPLWNAQEKYCRQLLAYHEVLDPGHTEVKTKLLLELRKILLLQSKVVSEEHCTRDILIDKLNQIKALNSLVYTKVQL